MSLIAGIRSESPETIRALSYAFWRASSTILTAILTSVYFSCQIENVALHVALHSTRFSLKLPRVTVTPWLSCAITNCLCRSCFGGSQWVYVVKYSTPTRVCDLGEM